MPWIRAYVDKAKGGEHSRIVDFEVEAKDFRLGTGPADSGVVFLEDSGRKKLKLRKGEEANHFAQLTFPEQAHVE